MRRLLLVVVGLAVVLAGCGAAPGGLDLNGSDDAANGSDAALGPERITPDLRGQQADTLRSGSFTYRANYTNPSGPLNLTLRVAENRSWNRVVGAETNRTEFTNASGTYIRAAQSGETEYRFSTARPDNTAFTVATIPYNATYERAGTGEIDGVQVARYEADAAQENLTLGSFAVGDRARFNATLHVTADGFVKRVEWRTVSRAGVSTYDATYSEVGATTVDAPPWVGEARSQPTVPQAIFEFERNGTALDVQHAGGDALDGERVVVLVNSSAVEWSPADGDVVAGDAITVPDVSTGATVRVVWTADGRSFVLGEHTVE